MSDPSGGAATPPPPNPSTPAPPSAPIADWYPDPAQSGQLRYWDGAAWTDHFHAVEGTPFAGAQPTGANGAAGLSRIGKWMDEAFKGLFKVAVPLLKMLAMVLGPALLLLVIAAFLATNGVKIDLSFDGRVSDLEGISGFGVGRIVLLSAVAVIVFVLVAFARLAAVYLLYRSHDGTSPTAREAIAHTASHFPRSVGRSIIVFAVVMLFYVVAIGAAVAAGIGFPLALIIIIPVLIAIAFYLLPRLMFIEPAIALAPSGTSPLGTVQRLASGRWAPLAGRTILLWVAASVGSYAVQTAASFGILPIGLSIVNGAKIDFESVPALGQETAGTVVLRDGVPATSLELSDVVSSGTFIALAFSVFFLYLVSVTVQHLILTAGATHIYRDLHGPADVGATGTGSSVVTDTLS